MTQETCVPNYFEISPIIFFYVFLLGCHGKQKSARIGSPLTTLKGDLLKIIPVKFGEIHSSGLRDVICVLVIL